MSVLFRIITSANSIWSIIRCETVRSSSGTTSLRLLERKSAVSKSESIVNASLFVSQQIWNFFRTDTLFPKNMHLWTKFLITKAWFPKFKGFLWKTYITVTVVSRVANFARPVLPASWLGVISRYITPRNFVRLTVSSKLSQVLHPSLPLLVPSGAYVQINRHQSSPLPEQAHWLEFPDSVFVLSSRSIEAREFTHFHYFQ